jgi:beta-galactosidase
MVHAPDRLPANPADFSVLRAAVRSRGDSGFIFVNNYVRNYSMPARNGVQFAIRLAHGDLRVPRRPVDVPSGSYFIWPFNLRAGAVNIRYSTAQLFTRIRNGGTTTLYFVAIPGIPVEFALASDGLGLVKASSGQVERESGVTIVSGLNPGMESFVDIAAPNGERTRLVALTQQQAENAWKVRLGNAQSEHLLITPQDFFADPESNPERIWLRSRGSSKFEFGITPPLVETPLGNLMVIRKESTDQVTEFTAEAIERKPVLRYTKVKAAGEAPPVVLGPALSWRPQGVARVPSEAVWKNAACWSIAISPDALDGLSELYLQVSYGGDVARLSAGNELLDDNFYNGQPWSVGLGRFLGSNKHSFEISVLPLRSDAPVYLELAHRPDFGTSGQIDKLNDLRLVPEYELVLSCSGH